MKRFPDFATIIFIIFALFAGTLVSCSDTAQRQSDPVKETDKTQLQSEPEEKIEGKWMGPLNIGSGEVLRVEFEISRGENGALAALVNSPDQGAMGIHVDEATFENRNLHLEIKSIRGIYEGKLKEDGLAIEGQWIQGGASLPLKLKRVQ